ncbi:hypothetical protein PAHAL_3G480400 [Panicum hallii]|uniref:Uncharacterized protein n=1 Tax=Panicum hallii TaxID=206008 RepID=A0A2S3HF11_9POAL|nr:kinesin-like protein KIN-12F [Panicum hallii]PAN21620.1 hypothetical protein PAHAL_3G480400 [Panicum hallii]
MARELGGRALGALWRTPARAPASGLGSDENAPPPGASGAATSPPAPTDPGAASRPPLRAIQPPQQPRWPVPTPKKGLGGRPASKTPARRGAVSTSLGPTKSLRKPALRSGFSTTVASSAEVPPSKVRDAILFWEENRSLQNVLPTLQQDDSQAPAKVEYCSDDGFMRNSEDILSLQLELDIIKTILVEEIKARAEIEVRTSALGDELKAANLHILEAYRQKEDAEKELNSARSVVDALESQQIILINKLDELKKKLKRMQASLEKACNLNTRYQQDQTSRSSAEQEMDEVRRQAEMETAEVIISLTEELSSVRQQLHATEKNELLAKQSLGEIDRIELLLDESIKTLVQKEVLEHNYVSLLRGMEEKISQLGSQLDQSDRCYKVRLKELEIKMQEVDDKASASLISWNEEREIAEQRKAYAEEKDEEVKLLERSIEDLEITVCTLEKKMDIMKEEVEHQTRQRGKIEVELQNVRQQLQDVPSSGKERSFLEDGIVDLASSTRHQNDMNSELLGAHESRIFQREVSLESAPQVEHPKEPFSDEYMQEADQSDIKMEKAQLSDMDSCASEELEQISASKHPGLFGSGADSDRPLPAFDLEQVRPIVVEPVIEVLKENELPPVSTVRPNDPVNYMRAPSDELKRLRSRNHYEGRRTATDRRFWSIEQQDLYTSIYSRAKLFDMKWIDWEHIDSIDQFACVREQCAHLGLEQIMSYRCDWNSELIRQFYSTVHISADKSSMTWMADGRRVTTNKRAWEERFGIPGGVHTEIHSQFLLDDDDKRILYTAAEWTLGQISGLSPLASIANKIIRTTIYPKSGNTLHAHNWNVLYHIVEQHPFDIIALIFGEIELFISDRSRTKDLLLYAPYIMGMIMTAFEYDGPRESRHHSYKPRHSYKLKRIKKVSRPPAHAVPAPFEQPPSTFQPEVEAAGHQPQGVAVPGQAVLPQAMTRIDLLQVVEDGLRPIRDSLASMEGTFSRVEGGPTLPVQHTNNSSSHIPAPHSSPAPSLQATTPTPPQAPAVSSEQASRMHADNSGVSAQPALVRSTPFSQPVLVRRSPFSRFPWYQMEK